MLFDFLQTDVCITSRDKLHRAFPHFGVRITEPLHRQVHCGLKLNAVPRIRLDAHLRSKARENLQTRRVHPVMHVFFLRRSQQELRGELRAHRLAPREIQQSILDGFLYSRIGVSQPFNQKRKQGVQCRLDLWPAQGTSFQEMLANRLLKICTREIHLHILVWDRAPEDRGKAMQQRIWIFPTVNAVPHVQSALLERCVAQVPGFGVHATRHVVPKQRLQRFRLLREA
mmetsp:Transcript_40283/g.106861  ORF Transcript_40283/g.106861 Transcript_40283/m.106861 type:complete len:228 (+) Transcript_40283:728-1411(+)